MRETYFIVTLNGSRLTEDSVESKENWVASMDHAQGVHSPTRGLMHCNVSPHRNLDNRVPLQADRCAIRYAGREARVLDCGVRR